jgi:hypothetical protein
VPAPRTPQCPACDGDLFFTPCEHGGKCEHFYCFGCHKEYVWQETEKNWRAYVAGEYHGPAMDGPRAKPEQLVFGDAPQTAGADPPAKA